MTVMALPSRLNKSRYRDLFDVVECADTASDGSVTGSTNQGEHMPDYGQIHR